MSISVNPGLKFCSVLVFYIPMHYLGKHFVLLLLYLVIKTKQYIVTSSCMFLDEKTMLEIWLNPGLNLTIFRGTGPRALDLRDLFLYSGPQVSHRQECFSSSLHKSFLWASDIFSLINSQSWVSTFSTSTTSAMFILPKSDMPEVKRALTHHLSRVFGAGKLTNHKCCEVWQVVMQMIKLKVCCKK